MALKYFQCYTYHKSDKLLFFAKWEKSRLLLKDLELCFNRILKLRNKIMVLILHIVIDHLI